MPCRRSNPLDETGKAILKALNELNKPAGCKEIAEKAGLETRKVMGKIRSLLNNGFIERPEKGRYIITEKGRQAVA
ncbi:MAG: hypothetical protein J7L38_04705 [Thermoproteales archaeon]|nr:hypothetical protein [Thermoproteales archaeon]RLE64460.1 MAG: hypothetical protein DRJ47_07545 [Thermoprotei archaeon]